MPDQLGFEDFSAEIAKLQGSISSQLTSATEGAKRQGQREVNKADAILRAAEILNDLDEKLDQERKEREVEDAKSREYMVRWNKINLTVSVVAIAVGVVTLLVDIFRG